MSDEQTREKRLAAQRSLDFVQDGMKLGLGSGSTAAIMVELLGERVAQGLKVRGVPTSEQTRRLAKKAGVPLTTLDDEPQLDLTIDGADEAANDLSLTKGGGGALLREKVVAWASRQVVIIADSSKRVAKLGAFPLPVEVVRFAHTPVRGRLREMGAQTTLRIAEGGQPFVTDEGNYILDCEFGAIENPADLARQLEATPGVMEHGLFVDIADVLLVGRGDQVETLTREGPASA